jgi:hypothetical protein
MSARDFANYEQNILDHGGYNSAPAGISAIVVEKF